MLEAVNPLCPENIHVATVTKVKGQHMWIRLEGVMSTFFFMQYGSSERPKIIRQCLLELASEETNKAESLIKNSKTSNRLI